MASSLQKHLFTNNLNNEDITGVNMSSTTPAEIEEFQVVKEFKLPDETTIQYYQTFINHSPTSDIKLDLTDVPIFIFHHGAGMTAQTFLPLFQALQKTDSKLELFTFDCRGHGASSDTKNFSLSQMAQDLYHILIGVYSKEVLEKRDLIFCGHSMGASVIVESCLLFQYKKLLGVIMMDVVEGTALDALIHMRQFIEKRPNYFKTAQEAVHWAITNGIVRNRKVAHITILPQLIQKDEEFTWRTDLLQTEPYWKEWFDQLSQKFLSIKAAKLLVLCNTERLDKPLTIAQIQGKFQMIIVPNSGHLIQEDQPQVLAQHLIEFWRRNARLDLDEILKLKLRPK